MQSPRYRGVLSEVDAGIDNFSEVLELQPVFLQQSGNSLRDEPGIGFVSDPPVFPHAVVPVPIRPPLVHEIVGKGVEALQAGDNIAIPQKQGCSTLSKDHLLRTATLPQTAIGGAYHDIAI